jgi:hypothetical protein
MEERAREILGQDFLGVEAVRTVEERINLLRPAETELTFNLDEVPEIPYSAKDLELAKENGEMLILRPGSLIDIIEQDITLADLVSLLKTQPGLFRTTAFSADDPYAHALGDIKLGWALVKKEVLIRSTSKTFEEQEQELRTYSTELRERGADKTTVKRRTATEAAWDIAAYFLNTGERLLVHTADKTSSRSLLDDNIVVGLFGHKGIAISQSDTRPYQNIGTVSSR